MTLDTSPAVSPPAPDAAPDIATPTPSPAPASPIAEAGAAFRSAASWGDVAPATERPAGEAPLAEATDATDATATAAEFTQDASGRWHRADGTYATAAESADLDGQAGLTAASPVAGDVEGAGAEEGDAEAQPDPIVVTIKGRNGEAVEIAVEDEQAAALLRANANDGMRREEFHRRIQAVESREAELREFEALLQTNPEAVILQHLPAEKQISLATALVAQHWDAIYAHLVGFEQDPTQRVSTAMQTQIAMRDQQQAFQTRVQQQQYLTELQGAVRALVPDGVDEAVAERFLNYAGQDLARAIQARGTAIAPADVPTLLAETLALFRFGTAEAGSPDAGHRSPAAPPPPPPARPVARLLAKPAPAPSATPRAPAPGAAPSSNATTVRRAVTAQRIAAAQPPAGAGAATVSRPALPANATLADVIAHQKKLKSWGG